MATSGGFLKNADGGSTRGVDAVSFALQRSAVINQWSVNPDLGVKTDWVVTFPTKNFYVDFDPGSVQAALNDERARSSIPSGRHACLSGVITRPRFRRRTTRLRSSSSLTVESCDRGIEVRVIDREEMARAGVGDRAVAGAGGAHRVVS